MRSRRGLNEHRCGFVDTTHTDSGVGTSLWRANSFAILATGGWGSTLRGGRVDAFAVVTVPDFYHDWQVRTLFGAWRRHEAFAPVATLLRARLSRPELWGYSKHLHSFA